MGIIAIGESCKYINKNFTDIQAKIKEIKDYLEKQLATIEDITINCKITARIPNTTSITFSSKEKLFNKLN